MESCKQTELTGHKQNLSGLGEIYSFSTMYNAPKGFEDQKPYMVALVRMDDGPIVTAQLTDVDHDQVTIGMRVEMVTRKIGARDRLSPVPTLCRQPGACV